MIYILPVCKNNPLNSNQIIIQAWTGLSCDLNCWSSRDPSKRAPVPVMIQRLFVSVIREFNSDCIVYFSIETHKNT